MGKDTQQIGHGRVLMAKARKIVAFCGAGDLDPHCEKCNGLIKPDTVSFGQSMPAEAMDMACQAAANCDLLLMIASSLEVQPANQFPLIPHQSGAGLIFVNRTATPYDHLATFRFSESAGQIMQSLTE